MKKLLIPVLFLFALGCKKNDEVAPSTTASTSTTGTTSQATAPTTTQPTALAAAIINTTNAVNVKTMGAKGDGVTDDTQAIVNALAAASSKGMPNIYFPDGTYIVGQAGNTSGVIALANGVGMEGNGAGTCHIKLSSGRYNPTALFYQAWWATPTVSNVVIQGIDFDGQDFNDTYASTYQYSHALSINNGSNIEVKNCKFESFRGDGLLFGDTFESSPNLRITSNVSVHDNEFFNIFREGTMFCCIKGGSFYNNNLHGNGYFVGGVDIERHSVNETVINVSVYNNLFNFDDGYGPVERGGPSARYRRAVTMGFFYNGYTNGKADGLSGGHKIYNNTIYQGQIDCWGHTNVIIANNAFTNTYENINGIGWLSTPAINIADPTSATSGLTGVQVRNNNINSGMAGNGISFNHYTGVTANSNTISNTAVDAISIYNASGVVDSNVIKNVGLTSQRASGIVVNGSTSGLVVAYNSVSDTRSGTSRTVNYAVAIQSQNAGAVAPKILYNTGTNLFAGLISQYYYQQGYAILTGNVSK